MIDQVIERACSGQDLSQDQMTSIIDVMMQGQCSDEQVAKLLTGLHQKGETADELAGAAAALRKHMKPINHPFPNAIDTCGTGGSGANTFNISTAAAIVAAAAGAKVAKHGNRRSTSKSGSADVLAELGVNIECSFELVQQSLEDIGLCFCFAPLFHPSVRHVMNVRRSLPHPTLFNLTGPLCNPAGTDYQLLGAGQGGTRKMLAETLARLGTKRAAVVHGRDGLGEISCAQPTDVTLVVEGELSELTWTPEDFGVEPSAVDGLKVETATESAAFIQGVLAGETGTARDIVTINAGAALWVTQIENDLKTATQRCCEAIDSGKAAKVLKSLQKATNP